MAFSQIVYFCRVHAKHLGIPLLGDETYGGVSGAHSAWQRAQRGATRCGACEWWEPLLTRCRTDRRMHGGLKTLCGRLGGLRCTPRRWVLRTPSPGSGCSLTRACLMICRHCLCSCVKCKQCWMPPRSARSHAPSLEHNLDSLARHVDQLQQQNGGQAPAFVNRSALGSIVHSDNQNPSDLIRCVQSSNNSARSAPLAPQVVNQANFGGQQCEIIPSAPGCTGSRRASRRHMHTITCHRHRCHPRRPPRGRPHSPHNRPRCIGHGGILMPVAAIVQRLMYVHTGSSTRGGSGSTPGGSGSTPGGSGSTQGGSGSTPGGSGSATCPASFTTGSCTHEWG